MNPEVLGAAFQLRALVIVRRLGSGHRRHIPDSETKGPRGCRVGTPTILLYSGRDGGAARAWRWSIYSDASVTAARAGSSGFRGRLGVVVNRSRCGEYGCADGAVALAGM
jgi:hypothetical protein